MKSVCVMCRLYNNYLFIYSFGNPKNIFLEPNIGLGANVHIFAISVKFICKEHCAILRT